MATLLDHQIMYGEEVTYGTRVVPTRTLEFIDESLKRNTEHIESAGLRKANRVRRSDRRIVNHKGAGGTVSHEVASKGFGLLFKHALGKVTLSQPDAGGAPTVWKQLLELDDPTALSLTTQVGRIDVGGTARPYDYVGSKVAEWELSQELDQILRWTHTLDAQDEKTDQALAVAAYPAAQELFHWRQCVVQVGGVDFFTRSLSLRGNNTLKTDRFGLTGPLKKKPLSNGLTVVTGALQGEFEDLTQYTRFVAGTIVPIVATWTGSVITGVHNFKLVLTLSAVQFDGETPSVSAPGVLELPAPFTVLEDGVNPAVKLELTSTDTAS